MCVSLDRRVYVMWVYDYWGSVSMCPLSLFITAPLQPPCATPPSASEQARLLYWGRNYEIEIEAGEAIIDSSRSRISCHSSSSHNPALPWEVISYAGADIQASNMKIHSPLARKYSEGQHESPFNAHKSQIQRKQEMWNLRKSTLLRLKCKHMAL